MKAQNEPSEKYSKILARDRFLNAVAEHFPKVLEQLRRDASPRFSRLFEIRQSPLRRSGQGTTCGVAPEYHAGPAERWAIRRVGKKGMRRLAEDPESLQWKWSRDFADSDDPKRSAVCAVLNRWGKMFYLSEDWIYDVALDTLVWWITHPSWPNRWHHDRQWSIRPEDWPPSLLINEEWSFEPWDRFAKRVQRQIVDYRGMIDGFCKRIGFDPDAAGNRYYHYEWLALFQVGRCSPEKIRKWHKQQYGTNLDESAITKGCTRAARRMELTLRTKYPRN